MPSWIDMAMRTIPPWRQHMRDLPYHHDWKPCFETALALRLKWFGRWRENLDWRIEPSRLALDLICFFYVEKGSCDHLVNGVPIPLQTGDLLVIRGGDTFSARHTGKRPHTSLSACISLSYEDSANVLLRFGYQRHYRLKDTRSYEKSFEAVIQALAQESRWNHLHTAGVVLQWLAALQDAIQPDLGPVAGNPETTHHVLAAQEWIQKRLGESVSIAEWASAINLNGDYFTRLFKAHTGLAPKVWLIESRLQRAARLLGNPGLKVEEVAGQCGFDCPFHFSRTFKRRFGISPAIYRQVRQVRGFVKP